MIKVNNIFKSFKEVDVLQNITFDFEKGAIVGFLGPNGAGKSTLIKILTGVISPDKGTIYINNRNIAENRMITKSKIGYIPEVPAGFNNLTVKEFLFFCGELSDLKKDKIKSELALIDQQFQIKDIFHKRMDSLSKGLRQRTWLIQALLHNPDVLLLDEPTDGLDPIQKRNMIDFIKNIGFNKTIIITSHTLDDLQILCNHVLIIKDGLIVFNDNLETVLKNYNDLNKAYIQIIKL